MALRAAYPIGKIACAILVGALLLSACSDNKKRVLFDGVYYPAKAKHVKRDRQNFVVTVRKVDRGVNGARAAGVYEGTSYCVENYGTSDILWTGAKDGEAATGTISGGRLTLKGKCELW